MAVAEEKLAEAITRIGATGAPVLEVRRL